MPRHVDHEDRRAEILDATLAVLAEKGPRGLTFRAVAARMGGSSTLVTHYFASRQALLDALAEVVAEWPANLAELEEGVEDPRERLRLFMRWLVPSDEQSLVAERGRVNLNGEHDARVRTQHLFDTWDRHVREHLRRHLKALVPARQIEATVDLLRSITNGITLSAVEHPAEWRKGAPIRGDRRCARTARPGARAAQGHQTRSQRAPGDKSARGAQSPVADEGLTLRLVARPSACGVKSTRPDCEGLWPFSDPCFYNRRSITSLA